MEVKFFPVEELLLLAATIAFSKRAFAAVDDAECGKGTPEYPPCCCSCCVL